MKKIISLLVVIVLVATMATTAFAAKAGETVTVEFALTEAAVINNFGTTFEYDTAALKLVNVTETGALAGKGTPMFNPGTGKFGFFGAVDFEVSGVILVAEFEVLEGAAAGEYVVKAVADANSTSNESGELVAISFAPAKVNVEVEHVHAYGEGVVTKAPTCLETGVMTYTCACGDSYTEVIPVIAHAWGEWKGVDDYYHCRECSVAGHSEKESHDWDETGLKCTVCGWEKDPNLDPVPGTGDITPVVVTSAFALIAMIALAGYMLKCKYAL